MNLSTRSIKLLVLGCLLFIATGTQANSLLILTAKPMPAGKYQRLSELAAPHNIQLTSQYVDTLSEPLKPEQLDGYDWVLIDAPRNNVWHPIEAKAGAALAAHQGAQLLMHEETPSAKQLDPELAKRLQDYYLNGGGHNFELFMQTLAFSQTGQDWRTLEEPWRFPEIGIYHPDYPKLVLSSAEDFLRFKGINTQQRPAIIGIAMQRQYVAAEQTALIDDLVRRIEAQGAIAMPLYGPMMANDAIEQLAYVGDERILDVLINTQITLNAEGRRNEFTRLGIPVIQASTYRQGDEAAWRADSAGMPLMDVPFYMAQAEYSGINDIMIAAAQGEHEQLPIAEQAAAVANKAVNLAALARTPAADKRLALMVWNSPLGEKNVAGAYLNLPASLEASLQSLKQAGYQVDALKQEQLIEQIQRLLAPNYRPADDQQVLRDLLADDLAARLPVADYQRWFASLPQAVQQQMRERWGEPSASSMIVEGDFVIPRLALGNLALLPQPPRGERGEDKEKALYHSQSAIPSHFYMAAYLWLREQHKAHALIHYGTHGTQEWLPGKERGLAVSDYPLMAVGDIPVVYPFIMDNIGEATQAKRRGRATIISYQTPPFSPAGLHSTLNELHDLLHDWQSQELGAVKDATAEQLKEKVQAQNIERDLNWSREQIDADFAGFINALHDYLHELAQSAQPVGLHTFGKGSEDDWRITNVMLMLGKENLESLAPEGTEADEQLVIDHQELLKTPLFKTIQAWVKAKALPADLSAEHRAIAEQARDFYQRLDPSEESKQLLAALAGQYVPTGYGADPVKNPEALPSGRNLYGFDPSRVPTEAAWVAGQQALEDLLAAHQAQSGQAPEKLTLSLWSVETMRHFGVLEAQAFAALGVRPIWDKGGRVQDVELISRQELGRPRVDVVLSSTGLYRDQFPNALRLLAKAAQLAAAANEADNPVYANAQRIEQQLLSQGLPPEQALEAAQTRIFAAASGQYGSGLQDTAIATDTFATQAEGDQKMAEHYLNNMQYAYGPNEAHWGQALPGVNLYVEHLKGTQGAVLARSSNLYGMLTTDDPFQYLGGISLAVRHLDGTAPQLYISNLRGGGSGKVENAARFLSNELATRNFHPGYIKGLMAEGYSGTLEIVDSLNNFTGWQNTAREIVRSDQWQSFADVYVKDKHQLGLDQWFEENNPHAQAQAIERMLEAARQGYWEASDEDLKLLKDRYQALAQKYQVETGNPVFKDFVSQGFGEQAAIEAPTNDSASQTVEGMRLEQVKQQPPEPSPIQWALWVMALIFISGLLRGARSGQRQ